MSGNAGAASDGPLAGVRVLDVSTVLAGPLAAQILGDYGADVIKVEHPVRPDSLRRHGHIKDGVPLWWAMVGRNKRCIGLHLGDTEAREIFLQLVATADVIIENFRPGVLERWGMGWEVIHDANPRVILVRVTGFGQSGPYASRPAFGTLAEAMSGFAAMTGEPDGPPTLPPFGFADSVAAMSAAMGALMALFHRDSRGGEGQQVDVSILAAIVTVLGPQPIVYDQLGLVPERTGNRSANNAPRNVYRTSDGHWLAISTSADRLAERLIRLIGRDDLTRQPWFESGRGRAAHADELDAVVGGWIGSRTRAEAMAELVAADVAVAPIYDIRDLMADPHVQATEMITTVDDSVLGPVRMQDVLVRMSATPGRIRWPGRRAYADTRDVLEAELGLDPATVNALVERGAVA
jgi:crotonobetainyl-CoA:carnitine CoA-transferase CaiB-like acyl-CoA transferase